MKHRDQLIDQDTGEINMIAIHRIAKAIADREFEGNAPMSWVRPQIENLKTEAYFVRRDWRKARGLPDDTIYNTGFTMPEAKRRWA